MKRQGLSNEKSKWKWKWENGNENENWNDMKEKINRICIAVRVRNEMKTKHEWSGIKTSLLCHWQNNWTEYTFLFIATILQEQRGSNLAKN